MKNSIVIPSVAELKNLLSPYTKKNNQLSFLVWSIDVSLFILGQYLVITSTIPFKVFGCLLCSVIAWRLFLLGHEAGHGNLANSKWLNYLLAQVAFFPLLTTFQGFTKWHNVSHHGFTNLAKKDAWTPLSVDEYKSLSYSKRLVHRFYSSPIGCCFYYLIEVWWYSFFPWSQQPSWFKGEKLPEKNRVSFLIEFFSISLLFCGWLLFLFQISKATTQSFVFLFTLSCCIPFLIGHIGVSFLTYMQHTNPKLIWYKDKTEHSKPKAQLLGTIHIKFPDWLDSFLHYGMQHTVHHVVSSIPFYNLKSAQKKLKDTYPDVVLMQEFSWSSFLEGTRICKLYDFENNCWLPYPEDKKCHSTENVQSHLKFVEEILNKNSFTKKDYEFFEQWLNQIACELKTNELSQENLKIVRDAFGDILSEKTSLGLSFQKKRGYAGDFEVIECAYNEKISEHEKFRIWDSYTNTQPAVIALRNRKTYFIDLLQSVEKKRIEQNAQKFNVLNIASGSGRDMQEFFIQNPTNKLFFDCIDQDADAIDFAKNLCADYLSQIEFHKANALKFRIDKKYNLIWSAGLFDYFNDKTFKFMLKRYFSMLEDGGEMVIGNFSENNPSRNYMEILGDWYLNHRSKEKLIELAQECDLPTSSITVEQEPLGVNLFLHIKK